MEITINQRLRELRSQKKNTQEQLATHLGISIQAVSKWERNEGYPDITLLPAIASFYNVTIDDLMGIGLERKKRKSMHISNKDIDCESKSHCLLLFGMKTLSFTMKRSYPSLSNC